MKLTEIKELIKEEDETSTGAFVGAKFSEKSNDALVKFIKDANIPNATERDQLHTTVMYTYSDVPDLVDETGQSFDPPLIAKPTKFEIFNTQDDNDCLVLRIECDKLTERHEDIIADYGAVYTHDEYKPHITLSYNCNDINIKDLEIPETLTEIEIIEEYATSLNPDWV